MEVNLVERQSSRRSGELWMLCAGNNGFYILCVCDEFHTRLSSKIDTLKGMLHITKAYAKASSGVFQTKTICVQRKTH